MVLSRKRSPNTPPTPIFLGEHPLELVDSIKHLGLTISSDLTWSKHRLFPTFHLRHARCLIGLLFRLFYTATPSVTVTIYLTIVWPQIEYACEVWDPYLQKDCYMLEQVQKFACKVCLKRWTIPYHDMLSQLHIPSLKDRRKSMRFCTLYKIIHGFSDYPSPPLLTRVLHHFSRHLHIWSLLQPFGLSSW